MVVEYFAKEYWEDNFRTGLIDLFKVYGLVGSVFALLLFVSLIFIGFLKMMTSRIIADLIFLVA